MDRHELNRMFDGLNPDPERGRELLDGLLQDGGRRAKPMKNWKRVVMAVAVAALLVTAAAAATVTGVGQRLLAHLGVAAEDAQAADLLLPGAMAVDITKEDNGAVLHVTQVLRDRYNIMILADFIAPEGTRLYAGDPNRYFMRFDIDADNFAAFLDETGKPIGADLSGCSDWDVLEDNDPFDNHISLVHTLTVFEDGKEELPRNAAFLQLHTGDLVCCDAGDADHKKVTVYSGDWSFEVPLPQEDIGWTVQIDQELGELDGAAVTVQGELYLSPMTLKFDRKWDKAIPFFGNTEQEEQERNTAISLWGSLGEADGITLTGPDGMTIGVYDSGKGAGWSYSRDVNWWTNVYYLKQITDPTKFQGGTLTLDWECGKTDISLDGLTPVEP